MRIDAETYWPLIERVNAAVNRDYFSAPDWRQYGKDEFWTVMPEGGAGDCEDYALTKRAILLAEIPASALRLATCRTETGQYHAVLIVTTDRGDYVLDNRYRSAMPWIWPRYRWHSMQDERGGWRRITNTRRDIALAVATTPKASSHGAPPSTRAQLGAAARPPAGWVDWRRREGAE